MKFSHNIRLPILRTFAQLNFLIESILHTFRPHAVPKTAQIALFRAVTCMHAMGPVPDPPA